MWGQERCWGLTGGSEGDGDPPVVIPLISRRCHIPYQSSLPLVQRHLVLMPLELAPQPWATPAHRKAWLSSPMCLPHSMLSCDVRFFLSQNSPCLHVGSHKLQLPWGSAWSCAAACPEWATCSLQLCTVPSSAVCSRALDAPQCCPSWDNTRS